MRKIRVLVVDDAVVIRRLVTDILSEDPALAVVLTGMGQDGLRGCEEIREAGGQVLVQDEDSSVVWGMPGFVANAGLADRVLLLDQLGPEIVRRVWRGRTKESLVAEPAQSGK